METIKTSLISLICYAEISWISFLIVLSCYS